VALVVPNYELLTAWGRSRGISGTREALLARREVQDHYMELVSSLTADLAPFEKIKKLVLLPRELSQEAGELTPTLKVKRRVVEERYKPLIDDVYQGAA
jgi:long-chain acyl-CoA synthetase